MKFLSILFCAAAFASVSSAYAADDNPNACLDLFKQGKKEEARACLTARLDADKKQALAERARLEAEIAETDRNAPKLPAE